MANINGVSPPVLNDLDYVDKIYNSFIAVDNHDHSTGKGLAISGAGIADFSVPRTKLSPGTADHVIINSGVGAMSSEAALAKVRGGTGINNSSVTFPSTGVIVTEAATETLTNKTLSIASNTFGSGAATSGQVLTADGAGGSSYATSTAAPDQSYEISNLSIACSVAASALTIALKDKGGSNASGASIIKVGFRNVTSATGTYNQRTITGALSTVISSGSTAGHVSGSPEFIYVYLLDNAGTVELAWSSTRFDGGSVVSTTAEGGAGAADSKTTMYSTTARSNVPCRLVGRLTSNQVTAGTWAAVPTEISLQPFFLDDFSLHEILIFTGNGHGSTATKIRRFTSVEINTGTALTLTQSAANGDSVIVNRDGWYSIGYSDGSSGAEGQGISVNAASLTTNINATTYTAGKRAYSESSAGLQTYCGFTGFFKVGDVIRPHTNGGQNLTSTNVNFHVVKVG